MIASKQIAFGKAAGKRKPYDAEVEYLESTGTQYIDTGEKLGIGCIIRCGMTPIKNTVSGYYFWGANQVDGAVGKNVSLQETFSLSTVGFIFGCSFKAFSSVINFEYGKHYDAVCDATSGTITIGGESVTNLNKPTDITDETCYIFCTNLAGQPFRRSIFRLSYWALEKNGELVLDLIPVRVGDVGYMYDRVSGQLFGNAGTGAFVLGSDI